MANLRLLGKIAQVELTHNEDGVKAICILHDARHLRAHDVGQRCTWTEQYDDLNDAAEYAQVHADRGI